MRFIIIALLLFISCLNVKAQTYRYKISEISQRIINSYGEWSDWSAGEEAGTLVVFKSDESEVTIYGSRKEVFSIVEIISSGTDDDGDYFLRLGAIDQSGLECFIDFVIMMEFENRHQVYLRYANVEMCLTGRTVD